MDKFNINNTICNPIPLPDYPIGRNCLGERYGVYTDYRETADPTVICEDGVWYLYPSCGMVYYTSDFKHWEHKHMEPYDCGYAPTVIKHKGKFYLTACSAHLYVADTPLGPFEDLGSFIDLNGNEFSCSDPMLFSDDDGRFYLYSGTGSEISCCELDADNPTHLITENILMFPFNTKDHEWERMGDWNEDASYSWIEGAWMHKRGDTYYLTYSASGTEWISYAMGAYTSKSPMGPWTYMETSPFLRKTDGLVRGTGHGSIVEGPNGTLWVFYTICMCFGGNFERRIAFDPLGFDENGNIMKVNASENPQWAPGVMEHPEICNSALLLPITQHRNWRATSCAPGRDGLYAIDDSMQTWWQPDENDEDPTLQVNLSFFDSSLDIRSMRIIWRDVGLDVRKGINAGPFGYWVEALGVDDTWVCVLDKRNNDVDMNIEYLPVTPMKAKAVRLHLGKHPEGIAPGVVNFTVFAKKPYSDCKID